MQVSGNTFSWYRLFSDLLYLTLGSVIAACAIQFFMIPNQLIDGGTIGLAMILAALTSSYLFPYFLIPLTLPFIYFAYRCIGKRFVLYMSFALASFSIANSYLHDLFEFRGDVLEIVVFGGFALGAGTGLIIRKGGCLDGAEITAILLHKRLGYTVGQIILVINCFIFALAGIAYGDWDAALRSLMLYMVAYKVIDAIVTGFDETKSVMVISQKSRELTQEVLHKMGLGVTIMYGKGAFTGNDKEILFIIVERLQLMELKKLIHQTDPCAFLAIQNLHEIVHPQPLIAGSRLKDPQLSH